MSMKTYWDLSEKERAALSRDEVAQHLDAELMVNGVLKVAPLVEQAEPKVPEPKETWYRIRLNGYTELDCAFPTAAAAQAFIDSGATHVETSWMPNQQVANLAPIESPQIMAVKIMTRAEKEQGTVALKEAAAVRAANEKARENHRKSLAAQEAALSGLWEDWHECREKSARMVRVADTLADYMRLANDEPTAIKFLAKAFTFETLREAEEWWARAFTVQSLPPEQSTTVSQ